MIAGAANHDPMSMPIPPPHVSWQELVRRLYDAARREWFAGFNSQQLKMLPTWWPYIARAEQLPPLGDWFVWLINAGRGFGKTKSGAEWIIEEDEAKQYLYDWFRHMGVFQKEGVGLIVSKPKRISFDVGYERSMTIGASRKPWFVGQQITIKFPHQTDDVVVQCLIEEISRNLTTKRTTVRVMLFDITLELELFIKDSFDSFESVGQADWVDSHQTKSEAPSQDYDIKDIS